MTDINKAIIECINSKKCIREISETLNLTEKQVYRRIRQLISYGYQLSPIYKYNSDIYYDILNEQYVQKQNSVTIAIDNGGQSFRALVISDMHIGNMESNIDLLKKVYEYAVKAGINVIFNCGDLIEGDYSYSSKSLPNIHDQLDFLIKKYPYDKSIKNFTLLGNHDYHALRYNGIDISKLLIERRCDIIPIGFCQGTVNIGRDSLLLEHNQTIVQNKFYNKDSKITLMGHGHEMKTKLNDKLCLCVPTLSYVTPDRTRRVVPGFIDLTLSLSNCIFDYLHASHLIINDGIVEVSQTRANIKQLSKKK